jgi:phosphatidylglycerophosphate synthase
MNYESGILMHSVWRGLDAPVLFHGHNDVMLWGMSNEERVLRLIKAQKVAETIGDDGCIWVNLAYAFDPQWLVHITAQPDTVVTMNGVPVLAHLSDRRMASRLEAARVDKGALHTIEYSANPQIYNHSLRKLETPFLSELTRDTVAMIERQSYFGAYKGVTDILTKYLWPEFALVLTRIAARLGMTPNMVTAIGAVGCIAAIALFAMGWFWSGVAAGFVFMVLDTVDGKLARCTITSSFWGNVFDHGLDLVHPPFWWVAWIVGLGAVGLPLSQAQYEFVMIAVLGGYAAQRAIEGIFIKAFDQHIHVWRPFDSWFRLITARRNPNMVLLVVSLLFGRPDLGMIAVAWWTIISLVVHGVRTVQAYYVKSSGSRITSWLQEAA